MRIAVMALKEYTAKRKFERTPEPAPGREAGEGGLRYVVHKHAARALHYDLRLELDGVLKSWAVPKGPSLDPSLKRMAVMVEDHPLEYKDFEGLIPEGNYGAGSVIIWDRGTYHYPSALDEEENRKLVQEGLRKGNLKFVLAGEKLHGEFALVRMGRGDGRSWLLMKKKDRYAGHDGILNDNRSVVSRRTLEDMLEDQPSKQFSRNKMNQIRLHEALEMAELQGAPVGPMRHGITPMFASIAKEPFDHPDWIYEVKWDGYRAVAEIRGDAVALYSRNGVSFNKRFSPVAEALRKYGSDAVLDGEIVVVDDQGLPDFQSLQHYQAGNGHLLYYVFDLLYFRGHDLTGLPLIRRKDLLRRTLPSLPGIRFSDHVSREGILFFKAAREKGLEGIMAKHSQSTYEAGSRTRQWMKVKTKQTQEGVIAGFTDPGGSRKHFGSLVLGAYEGDTLVSIGSVGSGFTAQDLQTIRERLDPLVQKECPFPSGPGTSAQVTWVRPEMVCEVGLAGWTEDGSMRQPVFLRLREDKAARDVVRENTEKGN